MHKAVKRARACHSQTIQVFSAGPSQWARRSHKSAEDAKFRNELLQYDIKPLFIHAPYLLNLATTDRELRAKSINALAADLTSADIWSAEGVIIHLGSRGESTYSAAIKRIASAILEARESSNSAASVILENSAGAGQLVGRTMAEIGDIVAETGTSGIGICIDTCHAFAGGYALHTSEGLTGLLDEIDKQFGINIVNVIHLNDSKAPLSSHIDRHEHIGKGAIGREGMQVILSEPRLTHLPFIMETPKSADGTADADLENLRTVRQLIPTALRPTLPSLR